MWIRDGFKTKKIVFTNIIEGVSKEYAPKPAIHFIPEWYREMEASFPKKRTPDATATIKKCIPVLDAITAGYIIVSPCDVYVTFIDGEPNYLCSLTGFISGHDRKQAYKHPRVSDFRFPKWVNPWGVKTPKGYSCLFIPPMHHPNPYFTILEGIVDTDNYYNNVNFPFTLNKTSEDFMIPAGTPIAQVIPFKRDAWELELGINKEVLKKQENYLNSLFFDRYKKLFWSRKSYS